MDTTPKKIKTWFTALKKRGELFDTVGFQPIPQPRGVYYADPFLYEDYLFVEKYDHRKGVIAVSQAPFDTFETVLETDFHLSFPCVVDHYMIPEGGLGGELAVYKAGNFPYDWKRCSVVFKDVPYADPVLYNHHGQYYVFVTTPDDNKLEIWKGHPEGEWTLAHRGEHLHSRGAGNIFEYQGMLLRPVQESEEVYGHSILFKEITIEPYTEKVVDSVEPMWYDNLIGTHTFNFNDDYVVIDGKHETSLA